MKTRIIALVLSFMVVSSTFAYDLSGVEKTKGDKIVEKINTLINKKPEAKREKLRADIVVKLKNLEMVWKLKELHKDAKVSTLVGYVINKLILPQETTASSRYPGCDKDDIALKNGQVWASCDVGATVSGKEGSIYSWGHSSPHSAFDTEAQKWPGTEWTGKNPQWPCSAGYHVPGQAEVESAFTATDYAERTPNLWLFLVLNIKKDYYYWTNESYETDEKMAWYFMNGTQHIYSTSIESYQYPSQKIGVRCVKN